MEQIKISFDGGQTVMNFAEAALLIQGSACIYSKKVSEEYPCETSCISLFCEHSGRTNKHRHKRMCYVPLQCS